MHGQYRDNGNIEHTRHRTTTKQTTTKNKIKKMSNTHPTEKTGSEVPAKVKQFLLLTSQNTSNYKKIGLNCSSLCISLTYTNIYPAISTFAVQLCYTNKCLLYSYQTNKLFVLYE